MLKILNEVNWGLEFMKEKYISIKHKYKECLVLIKNGSFYITFYDDALILNYF